MKRTQVIEETLEDFKEALHRLLTQRRAEQAAPAWRQALPDAAHRRERTRCASSPAKG